jgi:hypothetical protein
VAETMSEAEAVLVDTFRQLLCPFLLAQVMLLLSALVEQDL